MSRDPFDEVCDCEHEEDGQICVCMGKKGQAKQACQSCMDGNHKYTFKEKTPK